jgi:hypothetical protein
MGNFVDLESAKKDIDENEFFRFLAKYTDPD